MRQGRTERNENVVGRGKVGREKIVHREGRIMVGGGRDF